MDPEHSPLSRTLHIARYRIEWESYRNNRELDVESAKCSTREPVMFCMLNKVWLGGGGGGGGGR